MSIKSVMPSNCLILCHPLLLLPSIFPSIRVFSNESVPQSCPTLCNPCTAAQKSSLSITNSQSLPKLMSIESVMPSNDLILSHPSSSCIQSFPASGSFPMGQFFESGGQSIGSFSFNISTSIEYSGLISVMIDWLDLLSVQRTLKSLFQHNSSKASVPRCSAFFTVQLSHPYVTTGKTIALTRQTFVRKIISAF